MKKQIEYCGVTFDVTYVHSKSESRTNDHPDYCEEVILEEIFHNGVDFSSFISIEQQNEIEKQILKEITYL